MRFITAALVGCLLALPVTWATAETKPASKDDDIPCAKNTDVEKVMNDKGYALVLNMKRTEKNPEGIIETLWLGGQDAVITATTPKGEYSCIISQFNNVIVNPQAIEGIWENYKKQTKQKDI